MRTVCVLSCLLAVIVAAVATIPGQASSSVDPSSSEDVSVFKLKQEISDLRSSIEKSEAVQDSLRVTIASLNSVMQLVASATSQFGRIDNAYQSQAETTATLSSSIAQSGEKLTSITSDLSASIASNMRDIEMMKTNVEEQIRVEMVKVMENVAKTGADMTSAVSKAVQTSESKVNSLYDSVMASSGAAACVEKNQIYDKTAKTCRPAVHTRFFNNDDGRENGWLSNRKLTFTKWRDDTSIVIEYHDNMRVHGHHWCRANWRVYIDRSECSDPGRISFVKYNDIQHGYWMNFHVGGSAHGVCRKNGRGDIKKGQHTIEVHVNTDRCDTHTGYHGQGGYITVREVVVEKRTG